MKLVELTFSERLLLVQFLYSRQRTAAETTRWTNCAPEGERMERKEGRESENVKGRRKEERREK